MNNKRVKILLLVLLFSTNLIASEPDTDSGNDVNPFKSDYNSLFFTFDYSTQTNTFGVINESVKQPNYSAGLGFFSKYNFDISVQSIFTENADTGFSETTGEIDLILGYSIRPNENLTIYPSYTHLEYSKNISPVLSAFSDIAQLNLYYEKGVYFGGLNTSMLFGERNMFYLSLQNALGFYFDDVLAKNSLLSIQLEFDVNLSDKNYYNELIYDYWNEEDFLGWVDTEFPIRTSVAVRARIENYGLEETKDWFYTALKNVGITEFDPSYGISSVNFMLPVYYNIGNFMFNFTTFLVIPTFTSSFYLQNTQLLFNVGIAYSIDF